MLCLFETPAGYAIFKVLDAGKLTDVDNIFSYFENEEKAKKLVQFKEFSKFDDTNAALEAATALCDGELNKGLKKFLKKAVLKKGLGDRLAVADSKLGGLIKEQLGISCMFDSSIQELQRGIRNQLSALLAGLAENDLNAMRLGLSHSYSRHKIRFSPDKVDTMIIQAIGLLDELDKELNTYAMRVREWYGWHFPEMGRIVKDNMAFAKIVLHMGVRTVASKLDLSEILDEETEREVKEAAEISMGTEISDEDITNVQSLAEQVISIAEYRTTLYEYLRNRMEAIAPNLTIMVGELVGARLIAHAGSLMNLAKCPASTVQILGAEKALFRALKTKHDTPKYGLIYHASLVGQSAPKNKGKISRVLAAKTALAIRVDAMSECEGPTVAVENRAKVESRLRQLEGGRLPPVQMSRHEKYTKPVEPVSTYNSAADNTMDLGEDAVKPNKSSGSREAKHDESDKEKKKKKRVRDEHSTNADVEEEPSKKKRKKVKSEKQHKSKNEKSEKEAKPSKNAESEKTEKKEKKDKKKKSSNVKGTAA